MKAGIVDNQTEHPAVPNYLYALYADDLVSLEEDFFHIMEMSADIDILICPLPIVCVRK